MCKNTGRTAIHRMLPSLYWHNFNYGTDRNHIRILQATHGFKAWCAQPNLHSTLQPRILLAGSMYNMNEIQVSQLTEGTYIVDDLIIDA